MKGLMRPVYLVSGGVSKFTKARKDVTFPLLGKEAYDYALRDLGLDFQEAKGLIDGTVASYFSDHFLRQLKAAPMVAEYLGLLPKPLVRIEGGGATGGLCFQEGVRQIASGAADIVVCVGWETMSHVHTYKGIEFIALASDTDFNFPLGGFYSAEYAIMVVRHMAEFGTTPEQMAHVAVKNYRNAYHNPFAQKHEKLTIECVRNSPMHAWPLTRRDVCVMSDGAAVCILASDAGVEKLRRNGTTPKIFAKVLSIGSGSDAMRMVDRPNYGYDVFMREYALPVEYMRGDISNYYSNLFAKGFRYPGIHSFRAGRMASKHAYENAGIHNPIRELDFVELHDAYSSSEIQTYEDMGLCPYGFGGPFAASGKTFMPNVDYGINFPAKPEIPINPSGGLLACGHPVGATGLMQAVFALWQIQNAIEKHFRDPTLQVRNAKRGAIHSHAGTGTFVTVSILEREEG